MSRFSHSNLMLLAACWLPLVGCKAPANDQKVVDREPFPPSIAAPSQPKTQITPIEVEEPVTPAPVVAEPAEPARPEPTTFPEFMREGKLLMKEGNHSDAVVHFTRAAEMRPDNARPRVQMARALLANGDVEAARPHAELAIELDSGSSLAWNTMGRLELTEGDRDAAILSFQRAVDEDEDNSYAWNNLGYVLIELGRHDEAAQALEAATSGAAPASYMWNNLGMAYEHLDLIVEARAAYRQGTELGSRKAELNLSRLEGVVSLKRDDGDSEPDGETDEIDGADSDDSEPIVEDPELQSAFSIEDGIILGC